jgi:hexosaminidase
MLDAAFQETAMAGAFRALLALPLMLLGACATITPTPSSAPRAIATSATPPLIPMPARMAPAPGQFIVRQGTPLLVHSDNPQAIAIARQFADLLLRTRGIRLDLQSPGQTSTHDAIVLDLDHDDRLAPGGEGYRLSVDDHRIRIAAQDPRGLFYGTVTLWQLLTPDASRAATASVHNGVIDDHPRFAWRGLMLDSARHFQSVAEVRQLIDWMSLHKLNVLHWHLTDDQGWRLQIKRYPELTRIGSCRQPLGPDAALTGGADKPYCGYYTQDEVRDMVRYAAARYITIVPEIEMPGHAQAAIAAYPQFGVTGTRPAVSTDWGINTWLYNTDPGTITFLQNVLDEVMALFPSTYIHVGGDEAAKDQWKASPAIQAHMRQLGIADENGLQSWLIKHMETYLSAHGRKLIGWDEILEGGLPPEATVMSWRGIQGAIDAANQGHDVVLSPSPTLYLDHLQGDGPDEPPGRPQVQDLQSIYDFNPIPPQIDAAQAKHVLGAQANLWAEYMPTFARDQHAIFPRLAALAEVDWSPASAHDWPGFLARLPAQFDRYRALGIRFADSAFEPHFALTAAGDGRIDVALSTQTGSGAIHYTVDGSTPTAASPRYASPLSLRPPLQLQAATFSTDGVLLAAPRTRQIDAAALRTSRSDRFTTCTNGVVLRLEDDRPLAGPRPAYNLNVMDTCWQWKAAPTDGVRQLAVTVGNMPWNYQLLQDIKKVVVRPDAIRGGELDVHLDRCDGPRLARMSLQQAARSDTQTTLKATIPAISGTHDLCFTISGDPKQQLWAIDTVTLSP